MPKSFKGKIKENGYSQILANEHAVSNRGESGFVMDDIGIKEELDKAVGATLSEVEKRLIKMIDTFRCSVCQKYDKKNKTWLVKKLYHTPQCNDGWIEPSGRTLINLISKQIIKELKE